MNERARSAVLLKLIEKMNQQGSWCGETHIQKATYFLQELLGVPMDFDFILYKYGPFSFELKDHISAMRGDGLVRVIPQSPYGPSIEPDEKGDRLVDELMNEVEEFQPQIDFAASVIGDKDASAVEALATAYFVLKGNEGRDRKERATLLLRYKPHINEETAQNSVEQVDEIISAAKEQLLV